MTPNHTDDTEHVSNFDRDIQPGDIVRDKWSGKKLFVVADTGKTVAEYDEGQSAQSKDMLAYEGSIGTGATAEDQVFTCVYIKSNSSFSAGKKDYDYPESRLIRYAHETTNGDDWRVQDKIRAYALANVLFEVSQRDDGHSGELYDAIVAVYGPQIGSMAEELAQTGPLGRAFR